MPGARWIDLAIVLVYLIAMALIGVRVARRQNSTEAYFIARRSIPGWAMGISIRRSDGVMIAAIWHPICEHYSNQRIKEEGSGSPRPA